MYEISREKVVKLNVGNDVMTQESVSFMTQNTVIAGLPGSGAIKILDNILMNLTVNYSPEEVGIQYYSYGGFSIPWVNPNRKLPHMIAQTYDDIKAGDANEVFYKRVCECLATCIMSHRIGDNEECPNDKRKNIIILSLEKEPTQEVQDAIFTLMQYTDKYNCNVNVVVIAHYCGPFVCSLAEYAGLRVAARVTPEVSRAFFGHDIDTRNIKGGYAWVMERINPYVLQCLYIPFKPDTLCSKICKFLANDKSYNKDNYSHVWSEFEKAYATTMYKAMTYNPIFCERIFGRERKMQHEYSNEELRLMLVDDTIEHNKFTRIAPF